MAVLYREEMLARIGGGNKSSASFASRGAYVNNRNHRRSNAQASNSAPRPKSREDSRAIGGTAALLAALARPWRNHINVNDAGIARLAVAHESLGLLLLAIETWRR